MSTLKRQLVFIVLRLKRTLYPYFPLMMENTSGRVSRSRTSLKNTATVVIDIKPSKIKAIKNKNQNSASSQNKKSLKIKPEPVIIKSEYFDDPIQSMDTETDMIPPTVVKTPRKKRQSGNTNEPSIKLKKVSKIKKEPEQVFDIEDGGWKPDNWKEMLDNIMEMRKHTVAPVDELGCEECPEDGTPPHVFRYQELISVMLSSQTRDEVTFAASKRLIEHGLTVDNILNTSDEKIGDLIRPVGFWKTKIKYIKNTTQILKDKYNGDIPRRYEELLKLPGVGPKMAHLVMSCAWKDTVGIAVDTHVHRISNRLGWVPKPTKTPEQTRKALESWLPKNLWKAISLDLVGFGQTICKPIKPKCIECLNASICPEGRRNLKQSK